MLASLHSDNHVLKFRQRPTWCTIALFYNTSTTILYIFRALHAHHQEVELYWCSIWYRPLSQWLSGAQFEPVGFGDWLLFIVFISFIYLFLFPYFFFFCWSGLSYIFGCHLISYGLILLSLWICVLMILARESIFRLGYFSGFFLFVIIFLTIILYCTFRSVGLLFYIFFWK